jgi:glycosyltransferase involved in cell wall biosynthesis
LVRTAVSTSILLEAVYRYWPHLKGKELAMGRILTVGETPLITSGFANVLRRLNKYFIAEGHEVRQLGWCQTQPLDREYDYKIYPVNYPKGGYYGQELFDEIVLSYKPDIVFSLGDIYMVDWIPKTRTRRNFTWVSYFPIDSIPIPSFWCSTIENMDFPITYSKFAEEAVLKQVPSCSSRLNMIYHGVNNDIFYKEDKKEIRKIMKIGEDVYVLLYVGVNSLRKEIPRLIEAYSLFSKDKKDVLLILHTSLTHNAGKEGWFLKEVLKYYDDKYSILDKIVVSKASGALNGVPEEALRKIYNVSDVFVTAAECEGFGLPFVEAAACGVPSIAVNYSSMPELIQNRGELVRASDWITHTPYCMKRPLIDVKQFARKMQLLYENKKLRATYGKNAYEFSKNFYWENILPDFGNLIKEAIDSQKSSDYTVEEVPIRELVL